MSAEVDVATGHPRGLPGCAVGRREWQVLMPAAAENRTAITASVSLATLMQALDTTIANVSLPHMQGSFAASPDQIAWC